MPAQKLSMSKTKLDGSNVDLKIVSPRPSLTTRSQRKIQFQNNVDRNDHMKRIFKEHIGSPRIHKPSSKQSAPGYRSTIFDIPLTKA